MRFHVIAPFPPPSGLRCSPRLNAERGRGVPPARSGSAGIRGVRRRVGRAQVLETTEASSGRILPFLKLLEILRSFTIGSRAGAKSPPAPCVQAARAPSLRPASGPSLPGLPCPPVARPLQRLAAAPYRRTTPRPQTRATGHGSQGAGGGFVLSFGRADACMAKMCRCERGACRLDSRVHRGRPALL